jgi:hypothetical protein
MVGAEARRVKAAILLVLVAGCFWRSYGRLMATHAEVLVAIARKGADLVAGGRLAAESMPELTYPLERAEAFARAAAVRGDVRPGSLDAFERLLERYRVFVETLDRVRRDETPAVAGAALAAPLAAVEAAAAEVRTALEAEGRLARASALRLALLPVGQEALEADVRERVPRELLDDREGAGGDVRAHLRRPDHVHGVADAGDQNLRTVGVVVEDLEDMRDDFHAVVPDVVQAADEGGYERRAGLGGEQRLGSGEDERHVHPVAALGEGPGGLQTLGRHRALDDDVAMDARQALAFFDHAGGLEAHDLGAHGAVDDGADLPQHLLVASAALGDERGVRRDPVEDAPAVRFPDLGHLRGVDEDLHAPPSRTRL